MTDAERLEEDPLLVDLVRQCSCSDRLRNVLLNQAARSTLKYQRVSEFISSGSDIDVYFLRIPNMGRKCLNELKELVNSLQMSARNIHLPRSVREPGDRTKALPGDCTPKVVLQELLSNLTPLLRDLVERIWGLTGAAQSQAEVADVYRTSRERIRTKYHTAERILRRNGWSRLRKALFAQSDEIWVVLANGDELIYETELSYRQQALSPWIMASLSFSDLKLTELIDGYAFRTPGGWQLLVGDSDDGGPTFDLLSQRRHDQKYRQVPPQDALVDGGEVEPGKPIILAPSARSKRKPVARAVDDRPVDIDTIRRWAGKPESKVHRIVSIAIDHVPVSRVWLVEEISRLGVSRNAYGAIASLMTNRGNAYGRIFVERAGLLLFHPDIEEAITSQSWANG